MKRSASTLRCVAPLFNSLSQQHINQARGVVKRVRLCTTSSISSSHRVDESASAIAPLESKEFASNARERMDQIYPFAAFALCEADDVCVCLCVCVSVSCSRPAGAVKELCKD